MPSSPQPADHAGGLAPKKRSWRVVGRIAGRFLPSTTVRIGKFTIGPLPEGMATMATLGRVDGLRVDPEGGSHPRYYVARSGHVEVKSPCYFWIDKVAMSSEDAIGDVISHDLPLLQIAFPFATMKAHTGLKSWVRMMAKTSRVPLAQA